MDPHGRRGATSLGPYAETLTAMRAYVCPSQFQNKKNIYCKKQGNP